MNILIRMSILISLVLCLCGCNPTPEQLLKSGEVIKVEYSLGGLTGGYTATIITFSDNSHYFIPGIFNIPSHKIAIYCTKYPFQIQIDYRISEQN